MSLVNSVANCRKPFANGADRNAFYSKKYDVVIKKDRNRAYFDDRGEQMENEFQLFQLMLDDEREIFPIIDMFRYKGELVTIMKKCDMLNIPFRCDCSDPFQTLEIFELFNLDMSYYERFMNFVRKYEIVDLHRRNVGVLDNHLVILDAGY